MAIKKYTCFCLIFLHFFIPLQVHSKECASPIQGVNEALNMTEAILSYKELAQCLLAIDNTWHSAYGGCVPVSRKWQVLAEKFSLPLRRVQVESGAITYRDGRNLTLDSLHFFLVDQRFEKEIILDPTYLQFIKHWPKYPLEQVFIGDQSMASSLFLKHRFRLRIGVADTAHGVYLASSFTSRVYAFGENTRHRFYPSGRTSHDSH